jgi:hypothetical protein
MRDRSRDLNTLLLGDVVSEHAAPWELLAYVRHLEPTTEDALRRKMTEAIVRKQILEGLVELAEIRSGEAHLLSASDAVERLSRPETWDPEPGLQLELRPTELGTHTYYVP